jgi:hypothetical protein
MILKIKMQNFVNAIEITEGDIKMIFCPFLIESATLPKAKLSFIIFYFGVHKLILPLKTIH